MRLIPLILSVCGGIVLGVTPEVPPEAIGGAGAGLGAIFVWSFVRATNDVRAWAQAQGATQDAILSVLVEIREQLKLKESA